ncbi:Retinol dehydrogenase 12 [Mycena chlorophos]|uniref:Retinol dehydrogenase 12 n=1 Tax=Mycena chlorophos TaxID=658473 RepID=A0A8H6SZI0_MYCCL|nr:Retinol dehydrogenase 12 [Mycena chlorophos]
MKLTVLTWLKSQFAKRPPVVEADLTGKTVLVLGANTGLGFEATKHFATMNPARLILACRSESRGQAAVDKLKAQTGYQHAELWLVDLSDLDSIKRFADKFEADGGRLDILVENAAVSTEMFRAGEDGIESSLKIAALSTPYVALRLLPIMFRTAREHNSIPRLVVVSSEVHYWTDIKKEVIDDPMNIIKKLGSEDYCNSKNVMGTRYWLTKLANVLFVRALTARLPTSPTVIVNAVNPGLCSTELMREAQSSGIGAFIISIIYALLALTPEQGSRNLVFAAVGEPDQPGKLQGQFLFNKQPVEASDFVVSEDGKRAEERFWYDMLDIVGGFDGEVRKIVERELKE